MEDSVERSIARVIHAMRENLGEPITIDDMARIAMFSKFHFSRIFRDSTGTSPGRFLSALRLEEAKRLLTETKLSVADISNRVGYSSVGTFSSRFKINVGVAPSVYRETGGTPPRDGISGRRHDDQGSATIHGMVTLPEGMYGRQTFVGLFPDAIPQGWPVRCAELPGPGPYSLKNVPPGEWHVLACSEMACSELAGLGGADTMRSDATGADRTPAVGVNGPIVVRPGSVASAADVRLRPATPLDPPILLAPLEPRGMATAAI
ncbi:helix-turn-helix domain-containing protein [Actinomadura syzygii]|uniref:Helix-turn-helix transcriptional regulator n=1 Tax=Actinomadura syzygii TaxID=1427538 RepID=A0A5D0TY48_9ACTN|nr:AraC family transcriptional regulator [Actinomadura syzygii]TYC10242.1 helix-turn-helix transcriptional regulator [Actinomadura syzygii]